MKVQFLAGLFSALAVGAPTFNKDIAPILYENCATCHRPGEVAPFSLLTYQDAAKPGRRTGRPNEGSGVSDRLAGRRTRSGPEDAGAVHANSGWPGSVPVLRAADEPD
jgi:hypothetical protein